MIFTISSSSTDGLLVPVIVEVTQAFKDTLSSALPLNTPINFRTLRSTWTAAIPGRRLAIHHALGALRAHNTCAFEIVPNFKFVVNRREARGFVAHLVGEKGPLVGGAEAQSGVGAKELDPVEELNAAEGLNAAATSEEAMEDEAQSSTFDPLAAEQLHNMLVRAASLQHATPLRTRRVATYAPRTYTLDKNVCARVYA